MGYTMEFLFAKEQAEKDIGEVETAAAGLAGAKDEELRLISVGAPMTDVRRAVGVRQMAEARYQQAILRAQLAVCAVQARAAA